MSNRDYKKRNEELINVLKAIINKFGKKEIIISQEEIQKAKRGKIYYTREFMTDAKKYQLLFEDDLLETYKEDFDY